MAVRGSAKASVGLPPRGPLITTHDEAKAVSDIGSEWIVVALRPNGHGEWQPVMPYEDWRVFKDMMDDGAVSTVQRRDTGGTVLLARLTEDRR